MDESGRYALGVAMLISWLASLVVGWGRPFQTVPSSSGIVFTSASLLHRSQPFMSPQEDYVAVDLAGIKLRRQSEDIPVRGRKRETHKGLWWGTWKACK
jgi:hypothetical protein